MGKVRITATPPGEAPQEVREAWVGLELPIALGTVAGRHLALTSGVLSAPRSFWERLFHFFTGQMRVKLGYPVVAKEAVDLLALTRPDAAMWWRSNCAPMLDGKRLFLFPSHVCQPVPDAR